MDSVLPFSVLKSKRKKFVRIVEEQDTGNESRLRQADYDKNILEVTNAGLFIHNEHVHFITKYIYYFYRNNLAVLFLALNILHDPNFIHSIYYKPFIEYIQRRHLTEDKQDKQDMFDYKLRIELHAYTKKIQTLMSREHITAI